MEKEIRTIDELFRNSVEKHRDRTALRYKKDGLWKEVSYSKLSDIVNETSESLKLIEDKKPVALYMNNSSEWIISYLSILTAGKTAVPIDWKYSAKEVSHILTDSSAGILMSSKDGIDKVIESIEEIVEGRETFENGISKISLKTKEDKSIGRDIASIIYTSGTTGNSKGVMLSHQNFLSNVAAVSEAIEFYETDNFFLVLPLHHAFAFTANLLCPIYSGATISISENLKKVSQNMAEVNPTILVGVPALYEKMHDKIVGKIKGKKLGKALFKVGARGMFSHKIIDSLGGKIRVAVSGGGPLDPEIIKDMRKFGLNMIEGYGLTETSPVLTLNKYEDEHKLGSVGKAIPGIELKIDSADAKGIGEIIATGPNIMKGYLGNESATKEMIREGWLYTGDQGHIDKDGYVYITGRKKNIIINNEGKNIFPEEIEMEINKSEYILESMVYGYHIDGKRGERVAAKVYPDYEKLNSLKHLSESETEDFIKHEIKKHVKHISNYKSPTQVEIVNSEFEKTSTGKIKRYKYK